MARPKHSSHCSSVSEVSPKVRWVKPSSVGKKVNRNASPYSINCRRSDTVAIWNTVSVSERELTPTVILNNEKTTNPIVAARARLVASYAFSTYSVPTVISKPCLLYTSRCV